MIRYAHFILTYPCENARIAVLIECGRKLIEIQGQILGGYPGMRSDENLFENGPKELNHLHVDHSPTVLDLMVDAVEIVAWSRLAV
jgi:hypothetical protein